jgi:hypothetical protein
MIDTGHQGRANLVLAEPRGSGPITILAEKKENQGGTDS